MRENNMIKDLVELLLNYKEDEHNQIIIEPQAFQQILLYILQEEVLGQSILSVDESIFQQELSIIQKECEEILLLLKYNDE